MAVNFRVDQRDNVGNSFIIGGKWILSQPHLDGLIVQSISRREYARKTNIRNVTEYWEAWIVDNGQVQYIQAVDNITLEDTNPNTPTTWPKMNMPAGMHHDTFAGPRNVKGQVCFIAIAYWVSAANRLAVLARMPLGGAAHAGALPSCPINPSPLNGLVPAATQVLARSEYVYL